MKIETLNELEALLKLCHKQNVYSIQVDGITLNLNPRDPDADSSKKEQGAFLDPMTGQPMSDEEILFWSAQPRGN